MQVSNFIDRKKYKTSVIISKSNKLAVATGQLKHLFQTGSGYTNQWSNAFNFSKQWGAQTDPRTGTLSVYIKTGSLVSNFGHGPDIDLRVNYSSNATADPDGLGHSWSWNLTHFYPQSGQLVTSTGQNFYLQKRNNGQWFLLYHKLQDIRIDGDKKTHFIITYNNGLREILNHEGYETILEQQNGWRVHFFYKQGTHLLKYIMDDTGHSIILHYNPNHITVISRASEGQPVHIVLSKENNKLKKFILSLQQRETSPLVYIHYTGRLITRIDYPTGLKRTFAYNCKDAMKIPFLTDNQLHSLCVVSKMSIFPGMGQTTTEVNYRYSQANQNEHNYLGFNANLPAVHGLYKDILFEAPASYTYQTEEDNGIIREVRTYNKYHLLINDEKISDCTKLKISAVHTFFCQTDRQNGCANLTFTDLPSTYSHPLKIVCRIWSQSSVHPAMSTETMTYDQYGRIIKHKDVFGRLKIIHYCPEKGDAACPVPSVNWPANTLKEWIETYPAEITGQISPPAIITYNYYRKIFNYTGHAYALVLDHQIQRAGRQYISTNYHYYHNLKDSFTYGLLRQTVLKGSTEQSSALRSVIKNYYYFHSADNKTKTAYTATLLKSGQRRLSSLITTSVFTNQLLQDASASEKNITRYHYDLWGRLTQEDIATETHFATKSYYHYTVSPELNQLLITMADGLQKKIIFDGLGRPLMRFKEALSNEDKPEPGQWIPVQKTDYDNHGHIVAQHSYSMDKSAIHIQTVTQDYDDSGRVAQIHFPDGETKVMRYDDADRCIISYQKNHKQTHSPVAVVRTNILYKPVIQLLLPAGDDVLPATKILCNIEKIRAKVPGAKIITMTYDGFGRRLRVTDPLGHIIKTCYNAKGQVTEVTDPVGNIVRSVYDLAGHVIQSWAFPASGGHYLLSCAQYNAAGEKLWSAGEDGKRTFFTYTDAGRLSSTTTPSGHIFSIQYNDAGLPVEKRTDGKLTLHIRYDFATARIAEQLDPNSRTTFSYTADGLIRQMIYSGENGYPDYQLKWQYDKNRRITHITDTHGNTIITTYDIQGRTLQMNYKPFHDKTEMLVHSVYDGFSRLKELDYGSGMKRDLYYDTFGHLLQMSDTLSDKQLLTTTFEYDANNNIVKLVKDNEQQHANLNYQYDALNNLVRMTCNGSSGLPLCPRDTTFKTFTNKDVPVIIRQDYTFTPLNLLRTVRETLQNPSKQQTFRKLMTYSYTDVSVPLRLQQISTMWNLQPAIIRHFSYDVMGNMITDGNGNHMLYSASNQILQVIKPDGKRSNYTYDGSGREVKEKNETGIHYLFYYGNKLLNEQINIPGKENHLIGYLGVAKTTDGHITEYEENNYKGDVIGILTKNQNDNRSYRLWQRNLYSPYGIVFHNYKALVPAYKKTLIGFDGERTDPATGWQFLGAGHRTYNPGQRYFVSEDPSGGGYAFANNNPIMNTDPSGNRSQWLGETFKWFGYIASCGLNALHAKWANIAGAVMMGGLTAITLGTTVATYGGTTLAGVVAGGSAAYGAIPVVAAAIPVNKGLNIAASVVGLTQMATNIATAAFSAGALLFSLADKATKMAACMEMLPYCMLGDTANSVSDYSMVIRPGSLFKILKRDSPNLIDGGVIRLNNIDDISSLWRIINKPPFNAKCDTATLLLVVKHNHRILFVEFLEWFLLQRRDYALQSAAASYLSFFSDILNMFRENSQITTEQNNIFHCVYYKDFSSFLNRIIPEFGDTAVIASANHVNVLERHPHNVFGMYIFNKDYIGHEGLPIDEVESRYFGEGVDPQSLPYRGYLALPNPLVHLTPSLQKLNVSEEAAS